MKRADIKVGETYGVRLKASDRSTVVPATVVSIDEPVEWNEWNRWGNRLDTIQRKTNGILVKFVEPTRVGWREFNFASETNENAGEIIETYAFHPDRNGGATQVSKLFVGKWADIVARREAAEKARKEQFADATARADEFEPKLDAYLNRLGALGLKVKTFDDHSGIFGDVDRSLRTERTAEGYSRSRPTGFAWGDVRLSQQVFEWLLQQAEARGAKFNREAEYEVDDDVD